MRATVCIAALVVCLSFLAVVTASGREIEYVKDLPFSIVKSQPQQRLVVFYFDSDPQARPVLEMVDETAEYLVGLELPKLKHFQWVKVDCEAEENKPDCDEAGFKSGLWIFTSTPHEGIQSFGGSRDVATLATHIRHKFLPYNEADVLSFVDENALFERMDKSEDDPPKPIMVKFWEAWCEHCKKLKLPFDQAATYFKDQVEFMEVECSKNADTKAFCEHNNVKSFPTLILFDGERKHSYDQADKSITSFQNFFLGTLPEERYQRVIDEEAASLPPPPGSKKPAAAASRSDDDDEKPAKKSAPKKRAAADDDDEDDAPKKKAPAKKSRRDDDEEDDRPKKKAAKKSRRDDDDEEEEAPKKKKAATKKKSRSDDDDEEDDRPKKKKASKKRRDDDDDDEDDAPKKKSKKSSKKSRRDDDDDEEEEKPKKKKAAKKRRNDDDDEHLHDEL